MSTKKPQRINLNQFSQLGSSDFESFVTNKEAIFVDKTLFINAILASQQVMLFTRPRRWGKTLNLSMLKYFFEIPTKNDGTANNEASARKKEILRNLKIGQFSSLIDDYCGKYPVILVSFKDIKGSTYNEIEKQTKQLIYDLYASHEYLLDSPHLSPTSKALFKKFTTKKFDAAELKKSIWILSEMLNKHFEKKVIILIDEYDTPMNDWYAKKLASDHDFPQGGDTSLEEILGLFRSIFGSALKDNNYLEKGIITGILRIAKASLFSGLNNLGEDSILDKSFAEHFGFIEDEVLELLDKTGMNRNKDIMDNVRNWYNGYNVGSLTIYNPWSIMNFLNQKGELAPYWVGTATTTLIENALILDKFQEEVQLLIDGGTIDIIADPKMIFSDIKSESSSLYNLLLFSGYLTAAKSQKNDDATYNCRVKIPNTEVRGIFTSSIKTWLSKKFNIETREYNSFITHLLEGNFKQFETKLKDYLALASSYFSTGPKQLEIFYNGFIIGLLSNISNSYIVESEKESGSGRIDLCIIPKEIAWNQNAIIMEFKIAKSQEELKASAKTALEQISNKNYESKIKAHPNVEKVFKLGIAFFGKNAEIAYE